MILKPASDPSGLFTHWQRAMGGTDPFYTYVRKATSAPNALTSPEYDTYVSSTFDDNPFLTLFDQVTFSGTATELKIRIHATVGEVTGTSREVGVAITTDGTTPDEPFVPDLIWNDSDSDSGLPTWVEKIYTGSWTETEINNLCVRLDNYCVDGTQVYAIEAEINVAGTTYYDLIQSHNPKLYYRENDEGLIAIDFSPNLNHGKYSGTVFHNQGSLLAHDTDGSNYFQTNGYIEAPNIVRDFSTFSVEMWIIWDSNVADQRLFDFNDNSVPSTVSGRYVFCSTKHHDSDKCRFAVSLAGTNNDYYVDSLQPLIRGQRYHVVCIFAAGTLKLYINKVLQGTVTTPVTMSALNLLHSYFHRSFWTTPGREGDYYKGRSDEIALYDYDISSFVASHYDTGIGSISPLPTTQSITDYVNFLEIVDRQQIISRSVTDTLTIDDYRGPAKQFVTSSLVFSEPINLDSVLTPDLSDQLFILEKADVQNAGQNQYTDLILFRETTTVSSSKSIVDTLTFVETVATPGLIYQPVTHTLTFTESTDVTQPGKYSFSLSDTLVINETVSRGNSYHMTVSDFLILTENESDRNLHQTFKDVMIISGTVGVVQWPTRRSLKDTLITTERIAASPYKRSLSDTVVFTDRVRPNLYKQSFMDVLVFLDTPRHNQHRMSVSDTIVFDISETDQNNHQYADDTVTFIDTASGRLSISNHPIADLLTFVQTPVMRWSIANISITHTLTFMDVAHRVLEVDYTDTIVFTGTAIHVLYGDFTDTITFTETIVEMKSRPVYDHLDFKQTICVFMSYGARSVTDTLNFSSRVAFRINGPDDPRNPGVTIPGGTGLDFLSTYKRSVSHTLQFIERIKVEPDPGNCVSTEVAAALVIGVSWSGNTALWSFDKDITLVGVNVPELKITDNLGNDSTPTAVSQVSPTQLLATYTVPRSGPYWAVDSEPSNVRIKAPQFGSW